MKSTLKIGVITGLTSALFLFGFFSLVAWLNLRLGWGIAAANIRGATGLLSIPIQGIGIYIAIQRTEKIDSGITYLQALKTGLLVAVTVAVVVAVFSFLYCSLLNPGFSEYMIKDGQRRMILSGRSQQQINQAMEALRKEFATGPQVIMALAGQFFIGLMLSLFIALFVKSKKPGA